MIRIEDHCPDNLDVLASDLFKYINPKNNNGRYSARSLIARVDQAAINDQSDPTRSLFWNYLRSNSYQNLQRIITGRPTELVTIQAEIHNLIGHNSIANSTGYDSCTLTPFGIAIQNVFDYDRLYRSKDYSLIQLKNLKLWFCPYCNDTAVEIVVVTGAMTGNVRYQALLQVDHFFPQVRFPYLALSFFNLIPACANCNANLKGQKNFSLTTHFNPFHKRFDDEFKFKIATPLISKSDDIEVVVSNVTGHPDNAIVDFLLLQRYNSQAVKQELFAGYKRLKNRSPKILTALSQAFAHVIPTLFSRNDVLDTFNVPKHRNEIASKRLGKLKRDICIDCGAIQP